MLSVSTYTQNSSGSVVLYESSESSFDDMAARVSRTKTLDGGVVITHSGFSHGDRTFQILAEVSQAEVDILKTIHQSETFVWISCDEGFFSGVIDFLDIDSGAVNMSILIKEKLST